MGLLVALLVVVVAAVVVVVVLTKLHNKKILAIEAKIEAGFKDLVTEVQKLKTHL